MRTPIQALTDIHDRQARLIDLPDDVQTRAWLYASALADIADIAHRYTQAHRVDVVPLLVSALEALLEQADMGEVCEETQSVVDQARAAIAAARGVA